MSIDNWIWMPAGIRNNNSIGYRKYKSCPEMLRAERPTATAHQVFLAHGADALIDEQYFFESADDARWFWDSGYEERLCVDGEHKSSGITTRASQPNSSTFDILRRFLTLVFILGRGRRTEAIVGIAHDRTKA